jgi:hypothetical protein
MMEKDVAAGQARGRRPRPALVGSVSFEKRRPGWKILGMDRGEDCGNQLGGGCMISAGLAKT